MKSQAEIIRELEVLLVQTWIENDPTQNIRRVVGSILTRMEVAEASIASLNSRRDAAKASVVELLNAIEAGWKCDVRDPIFERARLIVNEEVPTRLTP